MRFISKILSSQDPIHITPFGGYANEHRFVCRARVLEDEGIEHHEDDGRFKNLWNSFKRFESDEVPDALVTVSWDEQREEVHSDDEGYVTLVKEYAFGRKPSSQVWHPIDMSINLAGQAPFKTRTEVLRPGQNARFGIISDVDDTLIHTGVSSRFKWRLLVNSIAVHSDKRIALDGAARFYTALHKGMSGKEQNPFFYVSNSPWNLHEYLSSFLRQESFPEGPLLLRDFGAKEEGDHPFLYGPKYRHIIQIMEMYPHLPFVLIGDAAELDLDIYLHVAAQYPKRVKAIYIRMVSSKKRVKLITDRLLEEENAPAILIEDSEEGMVHARAMGLIA